MLKLGIFSLISLFSVILNAQDAFDGYTLYTPGGGAGGNSGTTYLKDGSGTTIHTWDHDCGVASMPYLIPGNEPGLENSLLYYPCKSSNPTMNTGGTGGQIKIYNWDGDLLHSKTFSDNTYQHHHDIEPMLNGNYLVIAWERLYTSDWQDLGRTSVDNNLYQMWTTVIFEVEPDFNTGNGEIVWEWHIKDHLVQDRGSEYSATYGAISDYPELMDVNCGNAGSSGGPGGSNGDWMHINAIDYNEDLDQIVLSSRFQGEIYIIDHSTTTEEASGHTGGLYGKGGDFLYRWGNPQNYDRGNSSDEILDSQHGVNWIAAGYPGEGNLILYNNRHTNNQAAVLEIKLPLNSDGTYELTGTQSYGPDSWEWIYGPSSSWATDMQGGAFRLPNGNTIITDCDDSYIFEINSSGTVVWSYNHSGFNTQIARAEKYDPLYFELEDDYVLGDINADGNIDILDIVGTVNIVLGLAENTPAADLNDDNIVNILDVIQLVNLVLGS